VKILAGILILVLLMVAVVPLHQDMAAIYQTYPTEFRSYYVPSSGYMKMVSLGQEDFWADLIFIWSVQYFDRYGSSVRDEYLFHTFDVITDLDPRFYEAYIFGDLFLSLDKRWDLIYKLADKGLAKNPKNWLIAWDAGTYAFFQAKNYPMALKFFTTALRRNPGNSMLKDLVANAYKYRGDYRVSLHYWENVKKEHENQNNDQSRFFVMAAERNIWDLTIKIDLRALKTAIFAYKRAKGQFPDSLRGLVEAGFLEKLPRDPAGHSYGYDPKTGRVWSITPYKFKGKYAEW
jgi:tetratricopeptide (TPR) repeat protein